jgi:hypothetical protein
MANNQDSGPSGADRAATARREDAQPAPGGRTSRGPDPDPAGSVDVRAAQPSEGRTGGGDRGTGLAAEGGSKAFDATNAGPPGPGAVESAEERDGVPATDTSAASPLGVGVSDGSRGEDLAEDERGEGEKGASGRPYGGSSQEEATGVAPQGPTEPGAPDLQPGDQGG